MRQTNCFIYLLLGLLVLVWGVTYPVIKILLVPFTPMELMLLRFWIACPPLAVFVYVRRREVGGYLRRHPFRVLLLGLLGLPGYHLTLNFGTRMLMDDPRTVDAAATTAAILISSLPAWTALLARLVGQESMRPLQCFGQALAFAGVVMVVGRGDLMGLRFTPGSLVLLGAPLSWACYSVLTRGVLVKGGSSLALVSIALIVGTLLMTPLTPVTLSAHLASLSTTNWLWLLFLSLLSTLAGYVIWALGIKRLGVNRTSVVIYFIPLISLVASMLMLGERVGLPEILGGLLIVSGVGLTGLRKRGLCVS